MHRAAVATVGLILLTLDGVSADRPVARSSAARTPASPPTIRRPARHLERDRERRLEDRRSRHGLELAGRLGRSHLHHVGDQRRQGSRAGARVSTTRATSTARRKRRRPPLDGLRHRLQDRQDPLEARAARRRAADPAAHQEQLRVGDGGHRRRARLRVLRQHRSARRARHEGQGRLDEGARRVQRTAGVRDRPLARRSTRTACTSSTTTRRSRSWSRSTRRPATRSGGSSARGRSSNWATPFVWENERRTEIVTTGPAARSARTISTASCCGSSRA